MRGMVRHYICRHRYAVERGVVVGFYGQPRYCYRPYYPTARFRSPSSYTVSDKPLPDRSRPMSCWLAQMGSRPITFLWMWPATDHEPHCWHVPINQTSGSAARHPSLYLALRARPWLRMSQSYDVSDVDTTLMLFAAATVCSWTQSWQWVSWNVALWTLAGAYCSCCCRP